MVFQVSTSAKIAAASCKAMARRAGRGRTASALQITAYEDFQNNDRNMKSVVNRKSQIEASPELHKQMKKAAFHNMALVQPTGLASSAGSAAAVDTLLDNLLDGLSNNKAPEVQSNMQDNLPSHKRNLSSGTVAEMLMLRKELLLLHQLLDTLHR
jgi:hypothetical protein